MYVFDDVQIGVSRGGMLPPWAVILSGGQSPELACEFGRRISFSGNRSFDYAASGFAQDDDFK